MYILVRHRDEPSVCENLTLLKNALESAEQLSDAQEQQQLLSLFGRDGQPQHTQSTEEWSVPNIQYDSMHGNIGVDNLEADAQSDAEFESFLDSLRESPSAEIQEPDDYEQLPDVDHDPEVIPPYLPDIDLNNADIFNNSYIRVIHTNGVHHLGLISCCCRGAENVALDLVASQLIPTSFERIRTAYTASVLDSFRLCSLELKASAYQYYQLLCRYTEPMAHPTALTNLYDQFRRMTRLWRWMKKLKWNGFAGHNRRAALQVRPGELANFCPACPQIGINISANWEADPNR